MRISSREWAERLLRRAQCRAHRGARDRNTRNLGLVVVRARAACATIGSVGVVSSTFQSATTRLTVAIAMASTLRFETPDVSGSGATYL